MKSRFILGLAFVALQAFAEGESRYPERHEWPATCADAVNRVVGDLDEESRKIVRETPKKDLIKYHHGWGTGIRNDFGLWRGNESLMTSCMQLRKNEQFHPDSVSMIIIQETWARLNGTTWR